MSFIFRKLIQIYWLIIPEKNRRVCLYRESCSNYIYRIFKESGFIPGLKAMVYRYKNCNNNYLINTNKESIYIKTSENNIVKESDMNVFLLERNKNNLILTELNTQ